jgi:hypothetical protein
MTTNADVTIAEVIEVARRKQALLTPETAGYLVLGAADQLVTSPMLVDEHLCSMQVEGGRVSMLSRRVAHPLDTERGLRLLLRKLLEVSSGRAPALSNVAALPPKGDLASLLAELESALIPVNRGAAARALSRLARETIRARRPSLAPGEEAPPAPLEDEHSRGAPAPGDDTEPMQVGPEAAAGHDRMRDSEETLDRRLTSKENQEALNRPRPAEDSEDSLARHVVLLEPSLPRFPLDSSGEPAGRASDAFGFGEEATTSRRETIDEARPAQRSSESVDRLLDDCIPASPQPIAHAAPSPPLPAPTPPPPATRLATPQPSAVSAAATPPPAEVKSRTASPAAVAPAVPAPSASAPQPARDPGSDPILSSYPPPSARGVDELLQDFLKSTSRKQDRVAQDLRKMTGVDGAEANLGAPAQGSDRDEPPFSHAGGATDFYTSTPPPRAASASVASEFGRDVAKARPPTRRGVYAIFAIVVVAAAGGVALLRFEPGSLSGRTPTVVEQERRAAAEAASALVRSPPPACRATLVVTDVPQGAEVLVRSGAAPVDVERVPTGARLEFVAMADGYAPRRAVVPHGAPWDAASGKPRFELPIQLEKSRARSGAVDPWPPSEPRTVVGGQGTPGTVHVVTSPQGAEVWMVAGGSPEAKLESLPCGTGMEIMVASTQQGQALRRRLRVESARLVPEPGANTVTSRISAIK